MPRITTSTRLEQVEFILGSGTGVIDFAVAGEDAYYTWDGVEDADWSVEDVKLVENDDEDRFVLYPEGEYFICEIDADEEGLNGDRVRCWCE